ncbi:predicted protein [Uncinocarpus reesii 1704]|uniref:Uncharacterized protein n=1 Tax=Uncinocarpus reesii (strain UAMH 1704) TaxID=336963 RepID=C4JMK0_UNCRE|nr:uncharacterized protein UREG_04058 [Uncinocarpus reesii 1704]EEP79212.1 predicted protein [Uncinocarpus reesii 1704]
MVYLAVFLGATLLAYDLIGTAVETGAQIARSHSIIPFSAAIIDYYKKWMKSESEKPQISANPDNDYGLNLATFIHQDLCALNDCLNRGAECPPDFGVDFNRLFGFSQPQGTNSDVLIRTLLNKLTTQQSEAMSPTKTITPNMSKGMGILEQALQVCRDIYAHYDNILQRRPTETAIRTWQKVIGRAVHDNEELVHLRTELRAKRDQQINVIARFKCLDAKAVRPTDQKTTKKWAMLKILRDNAEMSQNRLERSQKELKDQIGRQRELERKFHETNMKLRQLRGENVTVHKLIGILGDCIYNLTDFQEHVQKLVFFFDGLELLVTDVEEKHARQFVSSIDNMLKIRADRSINQVAMERTKKKLKEGHYAVARELAGVYVQVSKKHIIPTVQFVENLGISHSACETDEFDHSKPDLIAQKAKEAQEAINDISEKRRTRLKKLLFDDQRAIEEVEQALLLEKEQSC